MAEPLPWEIRHEALFADCKVFQVFKQRCEHPQDARAGDFFTIKSADWVQVLAVTFDRKIILVRQFRFGSRTLSWEPPGGVLDDGENPVTAAIRELEEETAFRGENARIIGSVAPNPALFGNTAHFVLIENCAPTGAIHFDENEEIEMKLFAPADIVKMLRNGEIHHAISHAAFLRLWLEHPHLF